MALNGIDISGWQSGINISKMTTTQFVIVKATGGKSYVSDCWKAQANATLNNGKLLGLYHFARESSCKGTAIEEAKHFYNNIKSYIGKAILVLDWETDLNLGEAWAKSWLDEVYRLSSVKPLFYCYQSALEKYKYSSIASAGYKLWLAQYANYNATNYKATPWQSGSIGAFNGYIMHQYSSSGSITGYSGNLDINKFYGTSSDWKALCGKTAAQTSTAQTSTTVDYSPVIASGYQKFVNKTGARLNVYSSTRLLESERIGSINNLEQCICFGKTYSATAKKWVWAVCYSIDGCANEYKIGYVDDGGETKFN